MLNITVFTGKMLAKPVLRKDKRGESCVSFRIRNALGDELSCFATGNTARQLVAHTSAEFTYNWICHIIATDAAPDDRFHPTTFKVISWDRYDDTCAIDLNSELRR